MLWICCFPMNVITLRRRSKAKIDAKETKRFRYFKLNFKINEETSNILVILTVS